MGKKKINLIDTPGFNIFINDTKRRLVAADSALVVVDGVAGVEVQTEKVWSFADEFKLPRAIVINKLARERVRLRPRAGERSRVCSGARPFRFNCRSARRRTSTASIDLIRMKAYTYTHGRRRQGQGERYSGRHADAAQKAHEALMEMVAEGNDALMEEFFEKDTLPPEHIIAGLRQADSRAPHFPRAVRVRDCTTSAPTSC